MVLDLANVLYEFTEVDVLLTVNVGTVINVFALIVSTHCVPITFKFWVCTRLLA